MAAATVVQRSRTGNNGKLGLQSEAHLTEDPTGRSVVFYDGVCALCNGTVKFLLDKDNQGTLSYAPLQGSSFETVRPHIKGEPDLDSIVYVRGYGGDRAEIFVRSDAMFQILRDLGGFWRVVSWLRVLPRVVRNGFYNLIARHRYQWFGQYDECRLPTAAQRDRLLP